MSIYEKVTNEILSYLDKLNKNEEFKNANPNITAKEYLRNKTNPNISPKRLNNILNKKVKRITLKELCIICDALNIELIDLFNNLK